MSAQEWQITGSTQHPWKSALTLSNLSLNTSLPIPSHSNLPPRTALVRLRGAALNARDLMVIAHDPIYPGTHIPSLVPCADGAGLVVATGEHSIWQPGDRILIHPNDWLVDTGDTLPSMAELTIKGASSEQGTLRQYGLWADGHLVRAPAFLSWEECAALPACAATAMNALFYGPKPLEKGMWVLAQGTGGVSSWVIQLAASVGARVIATSSDDGKLEVAKGMGAEFGVNYRKEGDWAERVLEITEGRGVDHVVDVAGAGTLEQSVKAVKRGGMVSLVGFLSIVREVIGPELIFGGKSMRGVFNYTKPMLEAAVELVDKHKIHPRIAEVFEWEDAKKAFELMRTQSVVGKIIIRV